MEIVYSYADVLESYMIEPVIEADISPEESFKKAGLDKPMTTKEKLKAAAAITALVALGLASHAANKKAELRKIEEGKQDAAKKAVDDYKTKLKIEEYNKWKQSSEYKEYCKYVSNKYKLDYNEIYSGDYDADELEDKLITSIEMDLKKIAGSINRNKKLCNELADRYIEYWKKDKDYEKYRKSIEREANEIRVGPACANFTGYHGLDFEICDINQGPREWVCDEVLFDTFCDAISKKYHREIKLKMMSEPDIYGEGDEGIIEC